MCQQAGMVKVRFQLFRRNDGHSASIVNAETHAANASRASIKQTLWGDGQPVAACQRDDSTEFVSRGDVPDVDPPTIV